MGGSSYPGMPGSGGPMGGGYPGSGGPMGGGYPGASGAGGSTPAPPPVPVDPHDEMYLTIRPDLKKVLDRLEKVAHGSKEHVLYSCVTDLQAATLDTSAMPEFKNHVLRIPRELWDVTYLLEERRPGLSLLGAALIQKEARKFQLRNELHCNQEVDAKEHYKHLMNKGAPQLVRFVEKLFDHKIQLPKEEAAPPVTNPNGSGFPGYPGGMMPGSGGPAFPGGGSNFPGYPGGSGGSGGPKPKGGGGGQNLPGYPGSGAPGGPKFPGGSGGGAMYPGGPTGPGYPGGPMQPGAQQPKEKEEEPASSRITLVRNDRTIEFTLDLVLDQGTFGKMMGVATLTASILRTEMDKADRRLYHQLAEAARATAERGLTEANLPPGRFPPGAFPALEAKTRAASEPQNRISWMAALLPHMGQDNVYRRISFAHKWREPDNWLAGKTIVPEFLDPSYPDASRHLTIEGLPVDYATTHFVGIAGVGLDAALYPRDDPAYIHKRGIFGYEQSATLKEVAQGRGLSNTAMMIQVPHDGPAGVTAWIAGGGATVRGVPEKNSIAPFVLSTDRTGKVIQRDGKRGTYVLMADGSVRFVDQNISDDVFKAMCTIGGPAPEGFNLKVEPHAKLVEKPQAEERVPRAPVKRPPTKGPGGAEAPVPAGWIRFYAPEGYSVGMPQRPIPTTKDLPGLGKVTAYGAPVLGKDKQLMFYAAVGIKLSGDALATAKTPEGMRKLALLGAPADVKILKEVPVTQDGLKGMEIIAEATDAKAGKVTVVARTFLANDLMVGMEVAAVGRTPTAEAPPFFATLRIGDKAPPTAPVSSKGDTGPRPSGKVPAGWVVFKSPIGNYTVAMPQQPIETPLKAPTGEVKLYIAKLTNGTALVAQAHALSAEERAAGADTVLKQLVGLMAAASGGKVSDEKKLSYGQYEGRAFQLALKGPMGQPIVMQTRAYLTSDHLVLLQGPASAPETALFFDSLKIGN